MFLVNLREGWDLNLLYLSHNLATYWKGIWKKHHKRKPHPSYRFPSGRKLFPFLITFFIGVFLSNVLTTYNKYEIHGDVAGC